MAKGPKRILSEPLPGAWATPESHYRVKGFDPVEGIIVEVLDAPGSVVDLILRSGDTQRGLSLRARIVVRR